MPPKPKQILPLSKTRAIALGWTALVALPTASWAQDFSTEEVLSFELDPIIIFARRVAERLQETPIAVSVQSEDDIGTGGADRLADLAKTAPNVMAFDSNSMSYVVRGVGSQSTQGLNNEVGVGLFLDEVYIGRAEGAPRYLDDLEQAEIVRGSQSTIYGRNTIGGAVNLVTRRPGEELGGEIEVSVGENGYQRVRAAADVPLSEDGRWLSRTFLSFTKQPDGIYNVNNGRDDRSIDALSGRFSLSGELGEYTKLYFSIDKETVEDDSDGRWSPVPLALDYQSDLDFPALFTEDRAGAMLRVEHEFENFWFRSVTSVRSYDGDITLDGDFTAGPYDPSVGFYELQQGMVQEHRQITQEFRIGSHVQSVSQVGDFSWDAGIFAMGEDYTGYQYYDLASVPRDMVSENGIDGNSKSYSVFGNMKYQATDRLGVYGGLRYTNERKDADVYVISPAGTFFFGPLASGSASTKSSNVSAELGVDYKLSDSSLIYARASQGYKSGGIAQFFDAANNVNTYDPEKSLTLEAGLKTQLLDDRLALDFAVFNTNWQDQQSNVFINDVQRVTANASSATSKGFEIGLDARLSDEFRLRGSYGYLDAKYDDFRYTYFSAGAGSNVTVDYSGNPIPLAPRHSASLTLDWEKDLQNGNTAFASGTYSYRSSYTFDSVAAYEQGPTHLVDASVGIRGDNWEAKLWATNLLDENYLSNYFLFGNTDYGIAAPGRTVGFSVKREW